MAKELIKVCTSGKSGKDDAGEILTVDVSTLNSTGAASTVELCVAANCLASRDDFYIALSKNASAFYIHAWDKEKPLCKFFGHERLNCIQQVAEEFTVAGASNGNLLIWQTTSGDLVQIVQNAHFQSVFKICALAGDDPYFVTAGMDGLIKVWNVRSLCVQSATCQPLAILSHKSIGDAFLAFSGRILVCEENCVHLYDDIYAGADLIATFTFPANIHHCALNTLEDLLLVSSQDEVYMVDLTGRSHAQHSIKTGLTRITAMSLSEDDSKLMVGSEEGTIQLWDLESRLLVKQNDKLSKYSITGFYACQLCNSPTPKLNQFKRQLCDYKPLAVPLVDGPVTHVVASQELLSNNEVHALREELERLKKVNASLTAAILSENK